MSDKTYFFGWTNIKWLLRELLKMLSGQPSFFSKKRFESMTAFGILMWGCIFWLLKKYEVMNTSDFLLWSGVLALICGYTISMIEKAKKPTKNDELPKE